MTRNKIIPYKRKSRELSRKLRTNSTLAEVLLWKRINRRQLGYQFHRQVPMDRFIVDFYCHELKLAIEIDGATHSGAERARKDDERQRQLESKGVRFTRILDRDVKSDLEGVAHAIVGKIEDLGKDD